MQAGIPTGKPIDIDPAKYKRLPFGAGSHIELQTTTPAPALSRNQAEGLKAQALFFSARRKQGQTTKTISDPVHGPLVFNLADTTDRLLWDLYNTSEMLRLAGILQRWPVGINTPSDTPSRLSHSVGVLNVARRLWRHLERQALANGQDPAFLAQMKPAFQAAALLHDVGHGPLSHAFELVTGENHEKRTEQIITSQETEVSRLLKTFSKCHAEAGPDFPRLVAGLLSGQDLNDETKPYAHLLHDIFNIDRADYILRDKHFSGVSFKSYNLNALIKGLGIDPNTRNLYLHEEQLPGLRDFLAGYTSIYKHLVFKPPEHKAMAVMMQKLLKTYQRELAQDKSVPGVPPAWEAAFRQGHISLRNYLELTDSTVDGFLKACEETREFPLLSSLSRQIRHKEAYFHLALSKLDEKQIERFKQNLSRLIAENREKLKHEVPEPELQWDIVQYKKGPYQPGEGKNLFIRKASGSMEPLDNYKDFLASLPGSLSMQNCYCHPALHPLVTIAYKETLKP